MPAMTPRYRGPLGSVPILALSAVLWSLFVMTAFGRAQWSPPKRWGPNGCAPVGVPVAVHAKKVAAKKFCACAKDCACGSRCKCARTGEKCHAKCKCAKPRPADRKVAAADPAEKAVPNYGVDWGRVGQRPWERHTVNGREITADEAYRLIAGAGAIPEDGGWLTCTVIGPDEATKPVAADWRNSPLLAPYRDRYTFQTYRPEDVMVARYGFKVDGKPTIYLQTAAGQDLHRQDTYTGPALLAQAMRAALRKTDPNYRPEADPDLTAPRGLPSLEALPSGVWALAAVAAVAYFAVKNRKGQ